MKFKICKHNFYLLKVFNFNISFFSTTRSAAKCLILTQKPTSHLAFLYKITQFFSNGVEKF